MVGKVISFAFDACNGEVADDGEHLSFVNHVTLYVPAIDGIHTQPDIQLPVVCRCPKEMKTESSLIIGHQNATAGENENEKQSQEFVIDIYETESFKVLRGNNKFVVGQEIFFQLRSISDLPSNLFYSVHDCALKQAGTEFSFIKSVRFSNYVKQLMILF